LGSAVIDHQNSIGSADKPVGLGQEFGLERRLVPRTHRHKVMQLIIVGGRYPRRHRLQAFALAGADQSGHIKRAHAPPGGVMQMGEEGLEPGLEFVFPRH
jgi:hypothetical protein